MATEKTANFTAEMTFALVEAYKANPSRETVEVFAKQFSKSVRSIVAKLSREGVYIRKEYTTKKGDKPVAKETLADTIGRVLQLTENDTSSLAKANKKALQAIFNALANSTPIEG
jgi:hypothetical protein